MAFSSGTSSHYGQSNAGRELLFSQVGVGSGGELLDGAVGEGQWSTRTRALDNNPLTGGSPGALGGRLDEDNDGDGDDGGDDDDGMDDCASVTAMDLDAARRVPGFFDSSSSPPGSPTRSTSGSGSGRAITTASNSYHRSSHPPHPDTSSPSPSSPSSPSSSSPSSGSPNRRWSAHDRYPTKKYDPDFLAALR